jgi:hypothetical protein
MEKQAEDQSSFENSSPSGLTMAYVKMYDVAESARYIASRMVQRPVKTIDMLNIIVCAKAVVATHKPPPRPFK